MPSVNHDTEQYANNLAEVSHQPTRQRERQMRTFKSPAQTQRFLSVHGVLLNLFRVGRHKLKSAHHRMLRARSFCNLGSGHGSLTNLRIVLHLFVVRAVS